MSGEDVIRLLHWNVHSWVDPATGGSNAERVVELIHRHRPHAVSLVETDEPWAGPSTLTRIAGVTGYASVFAPAFEYGAEHPSGGFGNAVLTRLPIRSVSQRQLTWPDTVYDGQEPSEPRTLLVVRVDTGDGGGFTIGSTHLPRGDIAARSSALDRLVGISRTLPDPWVVCGDFNAAPDAWVTDAELRAVPSGRATRTGDPGSEGVDYFVTGRGVTASAAVLDATGSDHLAISATCRWLSGGRSPAGRMSP